MVTAAADNVVQFPDSVHGGISGQGRSRNLREARDLVAQKLRDSVKALIAQLQEDLGKKGDVTDERNLRSFYYGGRETLRDNSSRLEALVAGHWLQLLDAEVGGRGARRQGSKDVSRLDELQLVDLGDMDEEIAVKSAASRLQDGCDEGLFAAGRRLAYLAGRDEEVVPLDRLVIDAFQSGLKECAIDTRLRIEALNALERGCVDIVGPVVQDLNTFLIGRRVLPTVRRIYSHTRREKAAAEQSSQASGSADATDVFAALQKLLPGGVQGQGSAGAVSSLGGAAGSQAPAMSPEAIAATMQRVMVSLDSLQHLPVISTDIANTNVLREFRGSDVGQGLDYLDAVTVDIVATLFDFIFDDKDVSDPIKAIIGRLQIPVLKVAMLDKSFFSSKLHPARRLMDSLSRAAARCGPAIGHEDPLYAHIASIVDRLQSEFAQDARLFDVLCVELNEFLEKQERDADERAAKAAPLAAAQEHRELAAVAADAVLSAWLTSPLPAAIADLLNKEWRALLVRQYLTDETDAWESSVETARDLVDSVAPITEPAVRKALAAKLPGLVKRVHEGLDLAGVTMERRVVLLDSLFSLHASVLRGAVPEARSPSASPESHVEPVIVSQSIENGETIVESLSLVDSANVPVLEDDSDSQRTVDDLQRGDWVEFIGDAHGPVRYRLSWVSPERGILLFTNPNSPRALSIAPAALALQLERGLVKIVSVEPIFERAVSRALETLKAA